MNLTFLFTQPLDLQSILVETFAGNVLIFLIVAAIFIAGLSATFRLPTMVLGAMFFIFVAFLMGTEVIVGTLQAIYVIMISIMVLGIYHMLIKIFKQ